VPGRREQRPVHVEVHDRAPLAALLRLSVGLRGIDSLGAAPSVRSIVRERVVRVEVARDHDDDVVGRVVGREELPAHLDRRLLDVAAPADDRRAVGKRLPQRREQRLVQAAHRRVFVAQAPLLEHHLALAVERLRADVEVGEPLVLEIDHERQRLARDVVVVDGLVVEV
jgi:hypothetical protein